MAQENIGHHQVFEKTKKLHFNRSPKTRISDGRETYRPRQWDRGLENLSEKRQFHCGLTFAHVAQNPKNSKFEVLDGLEKSQAIIPTATQ